MAQTQFSIRILFWDKESFVKVDKQTGEELIETRSASYNFKTYAGRDLSSAFTLIENIFSGKERYRRSAKKLYIKDPSGREIYEFPQHGLAYPSTREKAAQRLKFLNELLRDMTHYRNKGFFATHKVAIQAPQDHVNGDTFKDNPKSDTIPQTGDKVAQSAKKEALKKEAPFDVISERLNAPSVLAKVVAEAWRKARGEAMPAEQIQKCEQLLSSRKGDKTQYFEYLCYCARDLSENKKTYSEFLQK